LKTNTAGALLLFLAGSFALIIVAVRTPAVEFYTGGIVIGLFIFGLFYAYWSAVRQGNKLVQSQRPGGQMQEPEQQNKQANNEEQQKSSTTAP
jgi:hypothetical protein